MSIITDEAQRNYFRQIHLPAPPKWAVHVKQRRGIEATNQASVDLKSTEAQALVVGSGLVVAADTVARKTRKDLVDCTLFAQLAAAGAVRDASKVTEWYTEYFRALTMLGWAQSSTQFEEYKSSATKVETHKAIMQVLSVLLGPQTAALAIVKTTLDALQSMNENSPWITLFDRQSATARTAKFQVATAEILDSGLPQVALVAFSLKSRSVLTQVLFFKFGSSRTHLQFASGTATIYEDALAKQRERVASMLDAYRSAYIGQIKFPPPP